jgi:hypothetical protein
MHWIFEGIGTALVIFILGLIARSTAKRRRLVQRQRARDHATQIQSGRDTKVKDD